MKQKRGRKGEDRTEKEKEEEEMREWKRMDCWGESGSDMDTSDTISNKEQERGEGEEERSGGRTEDHVLDVS